MSTASVTVAATVTTLASKNYNRVELVLDNQSAQTVEFGDDAALTFGNGITLAAGDKAFFTQASSKAQYLFRGAIYGIVTSGTADVRVMDLSEERG